MALTLTTSNNSFAQGYKKAHYQHTQIMLKEYDCFLCNAFFAMVIFKFVEYTSFVFQLGDVELTKAWLEYLATLGQKIPTFDRPAKEEEHSCAEEVEC